MTDSATAGIQITEVRVPGANCPWCFNAAMARVRELNGVGLVQDCPGYGHRVSIYSPAGILLGRFGDAEEGETPVKFIAPHGIAVDSKGDMYFAAVA